MVSNQERPVAVVTGASAGIGKAAAMGLAALGWRIIALGRDPQRSAAVLDEMRREAPAAQLDMIVADLAIMAQAARAACEVARLTDRVDVLLNNAGGIGKERVLTSEGNEAIFAGNHLGPFLLTRKLLPLLRRAAARSHVRQPRIVNVSSTAADSSQGFDWNDLQLIENYAAYPAYANAKLANLLFTRELARRLGDDRIAVFAMHPGLVKTNFANYGDANLQKALDDYANIAVSPEEGADTLVWLATASELPCPSGSYFFRREPVGMNARAFDDDASGRLWAASEVLITQSLVGSGNGPVASASWPPALPGNSR